MKRLNGFTVTCDKCGSTNCDIMQDGFYIIVYCYNKECYQEEKALEIYE